MKTLQIVFNLRDGIHGVMDNTLGSRLEGRWVDSRALLLSFQRFCAASRSELLAHPSSSHWCNRKKVVFSLISSRRASILHHLST
jgi:hypothetical protein